MTVCVAVINNGLIIGASDRMITSGDIQFEPELMRKQFALTGSIVAMWAGEASYQREVLYATALHIRDADAQQAHEWTVQEVTELYVDKWLAAKHRRAVNAVLAPIGLTSEQLLNGQHGFSDAVVESLMAALISFELPGEKNGLTETIISGIDTAFPNGRIGAHLYKTWNGLHWCEDSTGFVAIGAGAWHANSQLMLSRYHAAVPVEEALWRIYVAKRRAEVAPGVGSSGTDMFSVGVARDDLFVFPHEWIDRMDTEFALMQQAERNASEQPVEHIKNWLDEMIKKNAAKAPQAAVSEGTLADMPTTSASDQT